MTQEAGLPVPGQGRAFSDRPEALAVEDRRVARGVPRGAFPTWTRHARRRLPRSPSPRGRRCVCRRSPSSSQRPSSASGSCRSGQEQPCGDGALVTRSGAPTWRGVDPCPESRPGFLLDIPHLPGASVAGWGRGLGTLLPRSSFRWRFGKMLRFLDLSLCPEILKASCHSCWPGTRPQHPLPFLGCCSHCGGNSAWKVSGPRRFCLEGLGPPTVLPGRSRAPDGSAWKVSGPRRFCLEGLGPPTVLPGRSRAPDGSAWKVSGPTVLPGRSRAPDGSAWKVSGPMGPPLPLVPPKHLPFGDSVRLTDTLSCFQMLLFWFLPSLSWFCFCGGDTPTVLWKPEIHFKKHLNAQPSPAQPWRGLRCQTSARRVGKAGAPAVTGESPGPPRRANRGRRGGAQPPVPTCPPSAQAAQSQSRLHPPLRPSQPLCAGQSGARARPRAPFAPHPQWLSGPSVPAGPSAIVGASCSREGGPQRGRKGPLGPPAAGVGRRPPGLVQLPVVAAVPGLARLLSGCWRGQRGLAQGAPSLNGVAEGEQRWREPRWVGSVEQAA
ncbi:uncharacterized protein LOC123642187 [Lemur catta]|uniref:uncharacterized protein LOC123642187 n=1 Tax=Lemur catta TaxID=9447 RepID=UPI001E266CCF|nr:uncharacterized protein LOC123642187 [Lemur catta]